MSDGDIDFSKIPDPPALEPMQVLADGTRRFSVKFTPSRPAGPGEPPPNDQRLAGSGRLDVGPSQVIFAEMRGGAVHRASEFALADIANVEWSASEGLVVIRTARDDRHVAVWLRIPGEAAALVEALPRTVTPEFVAQRKLEVDFSERLRAVSPRARVVPALIAVNALVFLVMAMAGAGVFASEPDVHVRFGSNFGPLTWTGEPWRLLTSAFLHFGIFHIAFNMYALYNGGLLTERLYGSGRFLAIYLLAAVSGSAVSGWWDPGRNSAGASGAVFGVYGALLVFFALRRQEIPLRLLKSAGKGALVLCGYSLALGATSPMIDNACHVGGLLGGAIAGLLLARPLQVEVRAREKPAQVALAVVVLCSALALLTMPLWKRDGSRHNQVTALAEIQAFVAKEGPIVDRFVDISKSVDSIGISRAAQRMKAEVLQPWREATRPLLALDASTIRDRAMSRRVLRLQEYMRRRERAMEMTLDIFQGSQDYTEAEVNEIWRRVQASLDALKDE